MFWLQDTNGGLTPPLFADSGDVAEPGNDDVYVTDFSSREKAGQDLDVIAPGSWVRGPFAGFPGYNHLPFWSKGIADLIGSNPGNFFYVGGTSMAAPHVSATAALMLEKNDSLTQSQVEAILKGSATPIAAGSAQVWDPFHVDADGNADPSFVTFSWGSERDGRRPPPGRRGDRGDAVSLASSGYMADERPGPRPGLRLVLSWSGLVHSRTTRRVVVERAAADRD